MTKQNFVSIKFSGGKELIKRELQLNDIISAIESVDLKGLIISGDFKDQKFNGNFLECKIINSAFDYIDFSRCDWKDCRIESTVFANCDMGHASDITNVFHNCSFVNCKFEDTGISHTEFENCSFQECDFTNIIIKSSVFTSCVFKSSKTSNRMIESSLILLCKFYNMEIEKRLITGNFGLRFNEFEECKLFSKKIDNQKFFLNWDVLSAFVLDRENEVVERLRVSYFLNNYIESNGDLLDEALLPVTWLKSIRIVSSFCALISDFSRFLVWLYNNKQSSVLVILKFHTNNFYLLKEVEKNESNSLLYQTLSGIHLTLTKVVEQFSLGLSKLKNRYGHFQVLHFAANGPLDKEHFQSLLDLSQIKDAKVYAVRPRNSPVDLAILSENISTTVTILAFFLATKSKVVVEKILQDDYTEENQSLSTTKSLFSFTTGLTAQDKGNWGLDLQVLLPHSYLFNLNLQIPTKYIMKFGSVLLEILHKTTNHDSSNRS